eukprot:TRINITY_DN2330_c0_g1_i1.p2 TRINITY_DN2330_c0_g1~~TRINITY_DN2330_c0_g1_i1.p2  ORF type:complete len:108 (+),score=18.73 TRINITY_DN2330_c0_g1_i1:630-953(+)
MVEIRDDLMQTVYFQNQASIHPDPSERGKEEPTNKRNMDDNLKIEKGKRLGLLYHGQVLPAFPYNKKKIQMPTVNKIFYHSVNFSSFQKVQTSAMCWSVTLSVVHKN